jgi:hypothetical protein
MFYDGRVQQVVVDYSWHTDMMVRLDGCCVTDTDVTSNFVTAGNTILPEQNEKYYCALRSSFPIEEMFSLCSCYICKSTLLS